MTASSEVTATRTRSEQRPPHVVPGLPLAIGAVALTVLGVLIILVDGSTTAWVLGSALTAVAALAAPGFFVLQPNGSTWSC